MERFLLVRKADGQVNASAGRDAWSDQGDFDADVFTVEAMPAATQWPGGAEAEPTHCIYKVVRGKAVLETNPRYGGVPPKQVSPVEAAMQNPVIDALTEVFAEALGVDPAAIKAAAAEKLRVAAEETTGGAVPIEPPKPTGRRG